MKTNEGKTKLFRRLWERIINILAEIIVRGVIASVKISSITAFIKSWSQRLAE